MSDSIIADAPGQAADAPQAMPLPPPEEGWDWAAVEVYGHRRHVGRVREEERFGAKMLRVDIPIAGDPTQNGWKTHFYGGGAIFSLTPTDEASAIRANKPYATPARATLSHYGEDVDDQDAAE